MSFLADDFKALAAERKRVRKGEGLPDDDWKTAMGTDLDAIAAGYEIYRNQYESDYDLTKRVEKQVTQLANKHKWAIWV